jgi:hypothetical protein
MLLDYLYQTRYPTFYQCKTLFCMSHIIVFGLRNEVVYYFFTPHFLV